MRRLFSLILFLLLWGVASASTWSETVKAAQIDDYSGRDESALGIVDIAADPVFSGSYKISVFVASPSGCTGGMDGDGFLKAGKVEFVAKKSEFNSGQCRITAHLNTASRILHLVESVECGELHGARCGFSGDYEHTGQPQSQADHAEVASLFDNSSEPQEQKELAEQMLRDGARERLASRVISCVFIAIFGFLLFRNRKQFSTFIKALPAYLRLPKKLKIAIATYILWVLGLLLTNSFRFENVLDFEYFYIERFSLLAFLPLVFAIIAFGLFKWAIVSKKQCKADALQTKSWGLVEVQKDRQFYIRRTLAFIFLAVLVAVIDQIVVVGILKRSPGAAANAIFDSFLILSVLVFSQPLGFFRKAICWLIGMVAVALPIPMMFSIGFSVMQDIKVLLGSTQDPASDIAWSLKMLWNGSLIVSLLSLLLGMFVAGWVQNKWRKHLLQTSLHAG